MKLFDGVSGGELSIVRGSSTYCGDYVAVEIVDGKGECAGDRFESDKLRAMAEELNAAADWQDGTEKARLMKIEPCPHCKRVKVGVQAPHVDEGGRFIYYAECGNRRCRATGPKRMTERGAITAWNRAKR